MNETIAQSDDLGPRNLRKTFASGDRDLVRGFSHNFQESNEGQIEQAFAIEIGPCLPLDKFHTLVCRCEHVFEANAVFIRRHRAPSRGGGRRRGSEG